ncbi:MAG: HDOD domain-containing protein [Georgfuchsia sp.]
MGALTPEIESKLGIAVERMPTFPQSVQRVLELTRDINCKPKDLVAVLEKDPVMTMKILKVINSAYYSMPQRITSVNHSVIHLGINTIKNLSLSVAAAGMLPNINSAGFDTQRYLIHSLATATVARQLCITYGGDAADPGDCYVAGLLHDFGKVVFAQFMATEFRNALMLSATENLLLYQAERRLIGVDHGYAGAMLTSRWKLPEPLVECIRNHHIEDAEGTAMLDCLRVADQICCDIGLDEGPKVWDDQMPAAPERFGDRMGPVLARLGNLQKMINEARAFATAE